MKVPYRQLALVSVGFLATTIFVALEFKGRALGVALLLDSMAMVGAFFAIAYRAAASRQQGLALGGPVDDSTRRRYSRQIRIAKIAIVVLVALLLNGLRRFESGPVGPQLVGIAVNLAMIASLVWVVLRLRKTIQG